MNSLKGPAKNVMTPIDRSTATYKVLLCVLDETYGVLKSYHDAINEEGQEAAMQGKTDETPYQFSIEVKKTLEKTDMPELKRN